MHLLSFYSCQFHHLDWLRPSLQTVLSHICSLKSASKIPIRWQLVKQGHLSRLTRLGEHVNSFLSGTQWRSQCHLSLQSQVQELKPQLLIRPLPSKLPVDTEVLSATALSPGKGRLSQMAYPCHMKGGFQLGCSFFSLCVLMLSGLENSQEVNDRHTSDLQLYSKLSSIKTISHQSVKVQAQGFLRQHLMAKEAISPGPFIKVLRNALPKPVILVPKYDRISMTIIWGSD